MTIRIANGAGFLGDNLDAPRLLVENAQVDYLTLEYLAELTMSILARQREPPLAAMIPTPKALKVRHAPIADCARYDQLRRTG